MKIYEYRKHLVAGRIQDPEFITNGGNWYDESTDTYIAVMPDSNKWYIPDTLTILTTDQLIARVQSINAATPFKKRDGILGSGGTEHPTDSMTNQDVADMVNTWLNDINYENN